MFGSVRRICAFGSASNLQTRGFHQQNVLAQGLVRKLFGRKKNEEENIPEEKVEAETPVDSDESMVVPAEIEEEYKQKATLPKFPKRDYSKKQLELRIKRVMEDSEVELSKPDWTSTSIANKEIKFKVLTGIMDQMQIPVSNRVLNNVRTVSDLISELSVKAPSKDAGHPVAEFYANKASNIPTNMKFEPFSKKTRKLHARQ
ncbi:hypothetical protein COEREDRAFT_80981 [Coemansia reversa NRRL 1564]|uniref:Uncharacterized protein n=1 Tax=Coemansia reversa (strain ATCC 12441 / NRRL 1564) TaxID=763665 RepID=A0A2G5BD61_COERN|nr:hypothetical protein COEREDRAFT_80981 [Coemansia reversa NRRL 1564]|eukprot:PIA16949.1 hypothetical protein COEREDRAFT_80981 [Coemansia reversa NRRL 1564]